MKQGRMTYSRSNYIKQLCLAWVRTYHPEIHEQIKQVAFKKYPSKRVRNTDDELLKSFKEAKP